MVINDRRQLQDSLQQTHASISTGGHSSYHTHTSSGCQSTVALRRWKLHRSISCIWNMLAISVDHLNYIINQSINRSCRICMRVWFSELIPLATQLLTACIHMELIYMKASILFIFATSPHSNEIWYRIKFHFHTNIYKCLKQWSCHHRLIK